MKSTFSNIVKDIKDGKIAKIAVLCGAGISTPSGIPDFRSPGGMYDTLRPELITATNSERILLAADPTMVVDIQMFKKNQFPYLEVRRPFILGTYENQWKPSLAHFFVKVLEDKGLLTRFYTQNIDGLHYHTGISHSKIVPVHGSIAKSSCEFCKV